MRRDVFQAIADPVRRDILELIAQEDRSINGIAENFEISRPAISKHIKILSECGMITITQKGRERYCQIQPQSLIPAFMWLEKHKNLWEDRLDNFENYLQHLHSKTKTHDSDQ